MAQSRGEGGRGEECGVNSLHEVGVRLGFVVDTLPLGIVLEGFPVGGGRFPARMLKNVDKGVALLRLIEGGPISNAFHSVAVKKFYSGFAETGLTVATISWNVLTNDAIVKDLPALA